MKKVQWYVLYVIPALGTWVVTWESRERKCRGMHCNLSTGRSQIPSARSLVSLAQMMNSMFSERCNVSKDRVIEEDIQHQPLASTAYTQRYRPMCIYPSKEVHATHTVHTYTQCTHTHSAHTQCTHTKFWVVNLYFQLYFIRLKGFFKGDQIPQLMQPRLRSSKMVKGLGSLVCAF